MKKIGRIAASALLVCSLTAAPFSAMAAGPLVPDENSRYDEQTKAKLADNVLEYDEIPLLVHEYNSTLSQTREDMEKAQRDLLANADEMESHSRRLGDQKDTALSEGDYGNLENYAYQEIVLKMAAKKMRAGVGQLSGKKTVAGLQQGEDSITKIAQSLMISYDSLRKQRETLSKLQELYDRQYQLAQNRRSHGLGTDAEVLKAQTNQISALANVQSIDGGLMSIKSTLCTLTGWAADADPQIGSVPPVDLSQIAGMNLEEDTRKAIGNNKTLISQRQSELGKTNDGTAARTAVIDEGDQKMTIEMKRLYDDVVVKRTAHEAAQTGYQSAEKSASGADRMYELGLISEADFLGMKIAYYQKQAAYESSDTALRLAIDTYNWAVKGFADLD